MSDSFRTDSSYFAQLPWRTDVLLKPGGLNTLRGISSLNVSRFCYLMLMAPSCNFQQGYLDAVLAQEVKDGIDRGFFLLKSFCKDGRKPANTSSKDFGLFVKELLKYQILDIAAFIFEKGSCSKVYPRGDLPAAIVRKLVRPGH
jgi:hypothetical protein